MVFNGYALSMMWGMSLCLLREEASRCVVWKYVLNNIGSVEGLREPSVPVIMGNFCPIRCCDLLSFYSRIHLLSTQNE